jgi:DNA repair exonuclease SbcCD nuclease subunit
MFDSPLPDMNVVQEASRALRGLRDEGIRVYAFHGSHDRSPTESGIVDVLAETGLFQLVDGLLPDGDGRTPAVVIDGPTGAAITAVGGRRGALETGALEKIDAGQLEGEVANSPLAIFGFHGSVQPMLPGDLRQIPAASPNALPKGFSYYALGHIHHRNVMKLRGRGIAAYPGPTFGATFSDLASGHERGIIIVEVDDGGAIETRFLPITVAPVHLIDIDVSGANAGSARDDLRDLIDEQERKGAVVLIRAHGSLATGRPSELGISQVRQTLLEGGALAVHVSRIGLRGSDRTASKSDEGDGPIDPEQVFKRVLKRRLEEHETELAWLKGDPGMALADDLFRVLNRERGARKVDDHKDSLRADGMAILGSKDRMGGEPR